MLKSVGFVLYGSGTSHVVIVWIVLGHPWMDKNGRRERETEKSCCHRSFVHIAAIVPIAFSASLSSLSSGELSLSLCLCCFLFLVRSLPPNEVVTQAFPAALFYGVSLFRATLF
jgi:hypothetical protein